jgi:hypothetical protein
MIYAIKSRIGWPYMITEYNVKHNNKINKTYLQSKICDMYAKKQQPLLLVKIITIHSELIKRSIIDPYTLCQKNVGKIACSRRFLKLNDKGSISVR